MTNRNKNSVKICEESSINNECPGDACPIRPACAWRPDDDREVWTLRTNAAADRFVAKETL